MISIENIKAAIERADLPNEFPHQNLTVNSDHAHETYEVPALTSLKIRHLLNNIGALGTKLLSCGLHKSGTHSALIAGNTNLTEIIGIDSFESDATMIAEDKAEPQCRANVAKHKPEGSRHTIVVSDTFSVNVNQLPTNIDIYEYDADHSYAQQRKALTYFLPALADEFIYLCDDWDFHEVKSGTRQGLIDGNFEILFEWTVDGNDHDNDRYWNGYYIALLRKPKKQ